MTMFSPRGLGVALTAGVVIALSGCSDYPSKGTLDTQELRSLAAIVESGGFIIGIKEGGLDAYRVSKEDARALSLAPRQAWSAHLEGRDLPKIELAYTKSVDGFRLSDYQGALREALAATEAAVDERISEEVATAQSEIDQLQAQQAEVKEAAEGHEAYLAEARASYQEAEATLNELIEEYNALVNTPILEINALAEEHGLRPIGNGGNPVRNYRVLSFDGQATPETCPRQRYMTPVDLREEQNLCAYINIPRGYDAHTETIVGISKEVIRQLPEIQEKLGQERSYGRSATGAFGTRDAANEALQRATRNARGRFGDPGRHEHLALRLEQQANRLQARMTELTSDEYRQQFMSRASLELPTSVRESARKHVTAAEAHALTYIVEGPALVSGDPDPTFSGLPSGLETAIVVGQFIVESRGRREALITISDIDLTDDAVTSESRLVAKVSREAIAPGPGMQAPNRDELNELANAYLDGALERQ